jgi:hypothetical protein
MMKKTIACLPGYIPVCVGSQNPRPACGLDAHGAAFICQNARIPPFSITFRAHFKDPEQPNRIRAGNASARRIN